MRYSFNKLLAEAPDGIYEIETHLSVWNKVRIKLKTTHSQGKSMKFVTVPKHDPIQDNRGDHVPMCGIVNSPSTTYVLIEEI